jgi:hypothetical protein
MHVPDRKNVEFLKREVCIIFPNVEHDRFLILFKADINRKNE